MLAGGVPKIVMPWEGLKARAKKFASDTRAVTGNLTSVVLGIVVLVVISLVGVYLSASIYNIMAPELSTATQGEYGPYFNSTVGGVLKAFKIFGDFAPILILVFLAGIMIAVIFAFVRRGGRGPEF